MAGFTSVIANVKELSHQAVERLCARILDGTAARTVILDLHEAVDATTAAFARLVLLRRDLLKDGRDLILSGLHDRTASLYRINRLSSVLPML